MKKFLALLLIVCLCIAVLAACENDEFSAGDGTESQTAEGGADASEGAGSGDESTEESTTDNSTEAKAEQTFGGLQELKPIN